MIDLSLLVNIVTLRSASTNLFANSKDLVLGVPSLVLKYWWIYSISKTLSYHFFINIFKFIL